MSGTGEMIEALLNEPYRVIDILPERVPEKAAGRYFAAEKYWLQPPMLADLRRRFTEILLKLSCYYNIAAGSPDGDGFACNPAPELLAGRILEGQTDLCILLPEEETLITLNRGDLYMTVYHPSESLLPLLERLVSAEGLFLRQPEQEA